mgnify:CR=1 FL=1
MFLKMLLSSLMYQLENKSNIFLTNIYNIFISIIKAPIGVIFLSKIYV